MIHIVTPFRLDRNLGRAYNEAFERIGDDDWLCLMDIDCMFLTPNQPRILYDYIQAMPDVGMFTCRTNRISMLATEQLLSKTAFEITDIKTHIITAQQLESEPLATTPIRRGEISGFLMLVSKRTWQQIPCPEYMEKGGAIGVDTMWSRAIVAAGMEIRRMENIYVWHTYRLTNGVHDKSHLQ